MVHQDNILLDNDFHFSPYLTAQDILLPTKRVNVDKALMGYISTTKARNKHIQPKKRNVKLFEPQDCNLSMRNNEVT